MWGRVGPGMRRAQTHSWYILLGLIPMVKDIWVGKSGILGIMILLPREDEQGKEDGGRGVAPREAPVLPNLLSKLSFAFFDFLAS